MKLKNFLKSSVLLLVSTLCFGNYEQELKAISHNESNGGLNKNHAITLTGINKGHQAAGSYGLMPLTIKEITKEYAEYDYIKNLSHKEITRLFNNNHRLDKEVALLYWKKLRQSWSVKQAAFIWRRGSASLIQDPSLNIESDPYVVKFCNNLSKVTRGAAKCQ